jgi:hypothetical protein
VLSIDRCFETADVINNYQTAFEIHAAVTFDSSIFWDILPCNPVKINRRFGGKYSGSKNKPSKKPAQIRQRHAGLLLGLLFYPEYGSDMFLRNVGCISTDYTTSHPRR